MTTSQEGRQAGVRSFTGTTWDYNGDWSALFDLAGIPQSGGWNGRLLAWINQTLGTSYTEINGAMAAYAANQGASSWSEMATVQGQGGGAFQYAPFAAPNGFRWDFVTSTPSGEIVTSGGQPVVALIGAA